MDDMAAYHPPPSAHQTYYQPPPPHGAAPPPQPAIAQPQTFYHPLPPAYVAYPQPPLPHFHGISGDVRTLFIAGLPEDVKPREIFNLFRDFPGYESSHLRTPTESKQPFAFAVFSDQQSAVAALQALNGLVFDLEKGSTLYVDLAKSNSRSKRSRTTDNERTGLDKKIKGSTTGLQRGGSESAGGSFHMPGMVNSAYSTNGYSSSQSFDAPAVSEKSAVKSNAPPCPTLFVANLGPTCTEQELTEVFSRCSGFLKLKMQGTYGTPVAFVDFQDTACSMGALNQLQGTIIYSSPPGEGMRLEYAKSRMGMRRKQYGGYGKGEKSGLLTL